MISAHPAAVQEYRNQTDRIAAMYGFRTLCRKCGKSMGPAGRKKNMVAGKQQGWICAGCVKCA